MSPERRGALLVSGAALLWSTGGLGIKLVEASPLAVAGWRSAVAAAVLLALLRPPLLRGWAPLAAAACYAACLTTFVVATKWTTAANAIFLQYSGVVWVLVLSPLVVGEPLRARDAAAVAVALAGMALFFVGRFESRARLGDGVALLSGLFFAGIVLLSRRAPADAGGAMIGWGNALVALVLAPFIAREPLPGLADGMLLAYLGTVQIAAAYVLFLRGIRRVPAAHAAIVAMLEPIANPVWVFLALGETPGGLAAVGAAVVLGAIAWRTLR